MTLPRVGADAKEKDFVWEKDDAIEIFVIVFVFQLLLFWICETDVLVPLVVVVVVMLSLVGDEYSAIEEGMFVKRSCDVYSHLFGRAYLV